MENYAFIIQNSILQKQTCYNMYDAEIKKIGLAAFLK